MDMQEICEENGQYEIEQQELFVFHCALLLTKIKIIYFVKVI